VRVRVPPPASTIYKPSKVASLVQSKRGMAYRRPQSLPPLAIKPGNARSLQAAGPRRRTLRATHTRSWLRRADRI